MVVDHYRLSIFVVASVELFRGNGCVHRDRVLLADARRECPDNPRNLVLTGEYDADRRPSNLDAAVEEYDKDARCVVISYVPDSGI